MTLVRANLINSISLLGVGFWGYLAVQSPTALIPVVFGVLLLAFHLISTSFPTIKKFVLPISFALTVLILVALTGMRLPKSLDAGGIGLIRVLIMIATGSLSTGYYVKHFFRSK